MIRFSFTNLAATAPMYTSNTDTEYPASNAQSPQRPFKPVKILVGTGSSGWVIADLGGPTVLTGGIVAAINANAATIAISGDNTFALGPGYLSGNLTTARSINGRINYGHRIVGTYNLRYLGMTLFGNPVDADTLNYLVNGTFELWPGGPSAAPGSWTLIGAGASVAKATGIGLYAEGTAAAQVTRAGTAGYIMQRLELLDPTRPASWWRGRTLTLTGKMRATSAAVLAQAYINDGVGTTASSTHSGSGHFEPINITRTIDATATLVEVGIGNGANGVAQFDDFRLTATPYSLGGLWAGALVTPPRDVLFDVDELRERYRQDTGPDHGGWEQQSKRAQERLRFTCRRQAFGDTELAAWRAIDHQMDAADYFLVCLPTNAVEDVFVMRVADRSPWTRGHLPNTSELELIEVVR